MKQEMITKLHDLYQSSDAAKKVMDFLASRRRNRKDVRLPRLRFIYRRKQGEPLPIGDIRKVAQAVADTGAARVVKDRLIGTHGYSVKEIAWVAVHGVAYPRDKEPAPVPPAIPTPLTAAQMTVAPLGSVLQALAQGAQAKTSLERTGRPTRAPRQPRSGVLAKRSKPSPEAPYRVIVRPGSGEVEIFCPEGSDSEAILTLAAKLMKRGA